MAHPANFKTVKQRKHVIVLGAGPSINNSIKQIKKWQKKNNALVVGANHKYPIFSDYTIFVQNDAFVRYNSLVEGVPVVVSSVNKRHWRRKKFVTCPLLIWRCSHRIKPWNVSEISIDEEGHVGNDLGSSGFAAILFSLFARPKEVLIVGFDGRTYKDDEYVLPYYHKPDRILEGDAHKEVGMKLNVFFSQKLIPFVKSRGVKVAATSYDRLRGYSSTDLGISLLE